MTRPQQSTLCLAGFLALLSVTRAIEVNVVSQIKKRLLIRTSLPNFTHSTSKSSTNINAVQGKTAETKYTSKQHLAFQFRSVFLCGLIIWKLQCNQETVSALIFKQCCMNLTLKNISRVQTHTLFIIINAVHTQKIRIKNI
jgi:hypothetical protein